MNTIFNGNYVESTIEQESYTETMSTLLVYAKSAGKALLETTVKISKRLHLL